MANIEAGSVFDPRKIVVATNIHYTNFTTLDGERQIGDTDGIRGDLALSMVRNARRRDVRVVIANSGSSSDFLNALARYDGNGLTVVEAPLGRAPQRRAAFRVAAALPDVDVIGYVQAEKDLSDNLKKIKDEFKGGAKIVIPNRNPELFKLHWPKYMWESEMRVNATYNWLMRRAGLMSQDQSIDWFFGPVFFANEPEIVELFLEKYDLDCSIYSRVGAKPNPEMHSNGHYFPIIKALFNGIPVESVEIPYVYPQAQYENEMSPEKIEEFTRRRKLDADAYRLEAIHLLAFLRRDSKSKIRLAQVMSHELNFDLQIKHHS